MSNILLRATNAARVDRLRGMEMTLNPATLSN
jgi:hypothetical protein